MKFYKNLFIGKNVKNINSIIKFANENIPVFNIYFICIVKKSSNLMEIIESRQIYKKINSLNDYLIIGISEGKNEAKELLIEILNWWVNDIKKDFCCFKRYFFK